MGLLTPAHVVYLTDKLTAAYLAALGTSGSGYGMGDTTFGASLKALNLKTMVQGSSIGIFADADLQQILTPAAVQLNNSVGAPIATRIFAEKFGPFSRTLNTVAQNARSLDASIVDLDSFMTWENFGNGVTYWQCLAPPDWANMYLALYSVVPNHLNCYFDVLQGATYTNALAKLIVGTGTTLGASINILPGAQNQTPAYAGGYAWANVSGLTGSGLLTVTGHDQAGNVETWTHTISGNGLTQLTPSGRAYSLITSVSTVVAAGGISAATIYIEAHRPAGRTYPPT